MAFDEIAEISAAEEAARITAAEALAEARRIAVQAQQAGKTDIEEARAKAAAELVQRREQARIEAQEQVREIYQNAENKKAVLRAKAESRCDKAAQYIAERIVNA